MLGPRDEDQDARSGWTAAKAAAPYCHAPCCDRYRLARLAAKYPPEITLRDLTDRFSYDCLWRAEAWSKKGKSACGVYLPDLPSHLRSGALRGAARVTVSPSLGRKMRLEPISEGFQSAAGQTTR